MKPLRVALVHDYIKEYGGAERVLEALHDIYPDAPVYTSVYLPEYLGPHKERFKSWDIKTSFLQSIPFKAKLISPFRLLSPFIFKAYDFSEFDVIIVSATGAYFPNMIITKPQASSLKSQASSLKLQERMPVHICYCHTPPRYLYGYATAREWRKNPVMNVLGTVANHFLRMIDEHTSTHVDYYIANSEEVARRIKKFYRKDATVIYPSVAINLKFEIRNLKLQNNKSYFVTGGRLARAKHVDLVIKACVELGVPLKVFGRAFAGYGEELKQIAYGKWHMVNGKEQPLIEFLGEISDEEKKELLRNAKAAIFAFEDEDFGILPVEVMGEGIPVIAYNSGGLKETVVDGKTGVLFSELSVEGVKKGIARFETLKIDPSVCRAQAEKFGSEIFRKKITAFVTDCVNKKGASHSTAKQ